MFTVSQTHEKIIHNSPFLVLSFSPMSADKFCRRRRVWGGYIDLWVALIINSNLSKHIFKEKARSIVNNSFGPAQIPLARESHVRWRKVFILSQSWEYRGLTYYKSCFFQGLTRDLFCGTKWYPHRKHFAKQWMVKWVVVTSNYILIAFITEQWRCRVCKTTELW